MYEIELLKTCLDDWRTFSIDPARNKEIFLMMRITINEIIEHIAHNPDPVTLAIQPEIYSIKECIGAYLVGRLPEYETIFITQIMLERSLSRLINIPY